MGHGLLAPFRISPSWDMAIFAGLVLAALALRLWELDGRTMNYDEGIHVHYSWRLAIGDGYVHSPWMHGPFQIHLTALMFKIFSDTDFTARLLYALFGTALVALPFFLRTYLGRTGAVVTSILLTLSPSMIYFSRFGRNDILMAFWALALLVLMWRYLNEGKNRYLYMASAVLALAFATKETSYIMVVIFGAALLLMSLTEIIPWLLGRIKTSEMMRSPAPAFLILLATLTLPQWSALAGMFQDTIGAVLITTEGSTGEVGLPEDSGWTWSVGIIAGTILVTIVLGLLWRWKVWLLCAGIFYGVWITFYTTAFTRCAGMFASIIHPSTFTEDFPVELGSCVDGLYTGIWQGLGYWIAQQGVARGEQPLYYHLILGSVYEFLPLVFGAIAIIYYFKKGDLFGMMLGFWAVLTLAAYTIAAEKMPWLLVNLALPFILLAGKFIGDNIEGVSWRRVLRRTSSALLVLPPLILLAGAYVVYHFLEAGGMESWRDWGLLAAIVVIAAASAFLILRTRPRRLSVRLAGLGIAALMLGFSAFVAFRASYSYDDTPVEMLVYAQGSADISEVVNTLSNRVINDAGEQEVVNVDYEMWYPINWHVRHEQKDGNLRFRCYKDKNEEGYAAWCTPLEEQPSVRAVLLVESHSNRDGRHLSRFEKSGPFKNLIWFPESYKRPGADRKVESLGTQLKKDFGYIKDKITGAETWEDSVGYFLFRELDAKWWDSKFFAYTSVDVPG